MRSSVFPLFLLTTAVVAPGQNPPAPRGAPDPVFRKIPFEQWFSGEQAHIKWTQEIADPVLSPHQRLQTAVKMKIDGQDLAKRMGKGELGLMIQFRDDAGAVYQTHGGIDLTKLREGIKANDLEYAQQVFLLPGDYEASFAILDTATGEHATARRKVHVAGLKTEPLPDAWRDLPAVEFLRNTEAPDSFYLPAASGRLHLSARPQRPVSIELMVNLTPTERLAGSNRVQDRNLSLLVPALKLFTQTDWGGAPVHVSFLDLAHRKVSFEQTLDNAGLDWDKAKSRFADLSTGLVDVKTLENRKFNAKFFVDEVARRVEGPARADAAAPRRVVIILTSPVSFNSGVDRQPIESEPGDGYRVFYVRYHPFTPTIVRNNPLEMMGSARGPFGMGNEEMTIRPAPPGSQEDHLAPLLKGVKPELFDVENPEQFRKALAGILSEIARL